MPQVVEAGPDLVLPVGLAHGRYCNADGAGNRASAARTSGTGMRAGSAARRHEGPAARTPGGQIFVAEKGQDGRSRGRRKVGDAGIVAEVDAAAGQKPGQGGKRRLVQDAPIIRKRKRSGKAGSFRGARDKKPNQAAAAKPNGHLPKSFERPILAPATAPGMDDGEGRLRQRERRRAEIGQAGGPLEVRLVRIAAQGRRRAGEEESPGRNPGGRVIDEDAARGAEKTGDGVAESGPRLLHEPGPKCGRRVGEVRQADSGLIIRE